MVRIDINLFRLDVSIIFHALGEYVRTIEDQIEKLSTDECKRIQKTLYEDDSERDMELQNHEYLFSEVLPRSFRYSCIVSLFSSLEVTMNKLCDELRKRKELKLSVQDLKGNVLERTEKYIARVAQINFPKTQITYLNDLNKIRNCIVHAGGYVEGSKNSKELLQIVKKTKGLSISDDGYLDISKETCTFLFVGVCKWVDTVLDAAGIGPKPKIAGSR